MKSKEDRAEARRLKAGKMVERLDERGIDEIVAKDVFIHFERMDDNWFTLMVYGKGETVCYHIGAKRADVRADVSWRNKAEP